MLNDLRLIFVRDLEALVREIRLYPDDASLWAMVPGQPNSGGTLVLHLVGNLRHFIGATLGDTGYVRDRPAEFTTRGGGREDLVALVETARADVERTLVSIPESVLATRFPLELYGMSFDTVRIVLHCATHLSYHLGQIDYHRRALTGDRAGADAMGLAWLARPARSSEA